MWGGFPGVGNISGNPLFIDLAAGNLRLQPDSPCIDAGDNNLLPPDVDTDLSGCPRIQNQVVDMGAFEGADCVPPPDPCDADIDGDGEVGVDDLLEVLAQWGCVTDP